MIKFKLADGTFMDVSEENLSVFKERYPNAVEAGKGVDFSTETQSTESNNMGLNSDDGSLEQPEPSKASTLASSLAVGFVEFAKGFENLKEGVQLGTYELINEVGGFLTGEGFEMSGVEKQAAIKAIRGTNVLGSSESYDPIINKLEENIPEYETKSITEDLQKGNYAQAGFRTVNAALRSAPSLVAAATGVGGLVALGASTAGNKFEEELEADPEKSTGILLANAGITGATEATFELVTRGLLKKAGFLKGQGNTKAAKELLQGGAKNIVKNIGFGLTAEGASEAATELTVAFEDYIMLGKEVPRKDLLYRLGDAAIVGSFIGGTISSVGEVTKTMPNAKDRAEAILMPENVKQQISKKAEELNEFIDDLPNVSPEGKGIVVDKINEIENEIIDLKKESSLLINNLKGDNLVNYSKNIEEINNVKSVLNNAKTDSEKNLAEQKYKTLQEENVSILKDAKVKAAEVVTKTVKEQIKEAGLEGKVTEMTSEEISNIEEKGFDSKTAAGEFGFIKQATDGSFEIILNKDKPMVGTAAHEFMHAVLFKTIGNNTEIQNNLGDALVEHTSKLGGEASILGERLSAYGKWDGDTFVRDANFGEETITIMSESIIDGSLKFEENFFTKIGDVVRRFSQNYLGKEITFDTGRDVYNFVKDYSKSIKDGKINKAILNVAKKGAKGKLIPKKAKPEATVQMSKDASDKVQNIYEEQGVAGAMDIIEQFKPIVSRIAERRREAPNFDRELLMSEIEIGERGIFDLISKYDPDSGVPLAAYINKFLPSRAIEASRRVLGEEFTEDVSERVDIAAEEVAEVEVKAKPKKKKIILSDRLGVKSKVDKAIKAKLPELDIENLNFKTLKDQVPEITGEMFGISPKKLISGANITKKELQSAQMFINKNADVLISMLPEGATAGGTATGVPQTLLKAFYTKTDRAKMAKTGTKAGLAVQVKNDIKKVDFLETFGIIDGKPDRTDRNTSARVLALANQTGKMMTNQAVRQELVNQGQPLQALGHIADGKATVMFSKSKQAIGAIDRSLSPSVRVLFWDDISAFANEDILDRSLESIKIGLLNTYENIPEITGKIDELATALHKVIKNLKDPVVKNPIKLTEKLLETNNKQLSKVKEFFNSETTAADAFRQPQRVKNFRATTSVLANKIFNPNSLEKSIAKIIMMRGHLASSSRNSYLDRKQPYPGNPEFLKGTLGSIPGVEYKTKLTKDGKTQLVSVTYKGKNISLKKITSSQTSKAALNDAKDISKLKERSKNEDLAIELLDEITDFYTELYNNGEIDNVDLQMVSASLLSNMDAVLARAAKLKYISDNAYDFENPGKEVKYEHMQPRVAVLLNLWDAKINGDGITDVKDFLKNYTIQVIPNTMDKVITESKLGESLYIGQTLDMPSWIRTYNEATKENDKGRLRPLIDVYTKKVLKPSEAIVKALRILKPDIKKNKTLNKAIAFSRSANNETKGITVLDFDDTLATSKSLVISTSPDGAVRKLTAEEFATEGADLLDQGWVHDFSEFSKVVDGKVASLFKKAMKLQGKFGPENMFVLTARPADSAPAIFEFLKANGLNIPLKNITGLANSTSEAKALWIADKVGEGYNDFYFADDALQNVQAVKNMLDQFDVKSKVQQARVKFSKSMNDQFNDILENVTGIESDKRFSIIKGRKRGESKGKFRFFIPPSHEDFVGLLYNFLGKGKEGNAHRDFFEQALIRPLNRANREYDTARQSVANDYKELNKQFEDVRKKLTKKTPDGDFTFQDAIRVYLWDKHGHKIPGLSETDQTKLSELVTSDPQLQAYAETLNVISKQETYVNPTDGWNGGDIRMDLDDATGRVGRKQFFTEFIENAEIIFSEENLNKIEAGYGKGVRESLEDMLYRIKTGRNRPSGQNEQVNKLMNYLNGSVGTVMFFNMRSALLQQMSIVNYINFADNNIFAAAKAFANQKQYWADFAFIFNSDMLKQRRGGIQTDVNGAELAASLRNSKDITRKLISKLLELGFLPTQIGDNIAIATGGAAYYRNRINKYIKQGMSKKEAETAAFTDFQDITQSTQQSARPDMVSKQQASVIGKVILNFQNVTSQFNRLGKKAFQDIYNRRITKPNATQMQSDISNAARITYYFAIQNAIFYTLQTALFAMMFDDDEEDNNNLFLKKRERLINGSIDSVLRGTGLIGGVVATLKNVAIAFARQRDVKYNPDESAVMLEAFNLSPVLGIKGRKIVNAEKTLNYNKKVIDEMKTLDIDNPQWSAVTNYTEAFTNLPLNRLYNKTQNVRQSLNNDHAAWERTLMFLGWSQYNLDLENKKMEEIKEKTKSKKKNKPSKKTKTTKSRTIRF